MPVRTLQTSIRGQQGSQLRAAVIVNSVPNGTTVAITVKDAQPGALLPWHIHEGACGSGGVVGAADAYTPLQVGVDGTAEGRTTLKVGLDPDQTYHVNIHKSPQEAAVIIGCGVLH
ncbi:MAG TPA: hypothetical protein VJ957_05525 [Longimicrobiales bacterium]|nr:hypothetical protein [Longimicrobiales bacterium]